MLKFDGLKNQCIYCKKPMAVRQICRHITPELQEIEFLDSHKMCRKYALTIAFLQTENNHLNEKIKKNDKSIVDMQYKMFLKSHEDK